MIRRSARHSILIFFFFNDTATTEIYTLSLHDALPIYRHTNSLIGPYEESFLGLLTVREVHRQPHSVDPLRVEFRIRSEEHTSELQSRQYLVCRLLLEKKNQDTPIHRIHSSACTKKHLT